MRSALDLLIAERDRLDQVIALLQGTAPRRGRPPGRKPKKAAAKAARKTNTMSPAQRKAVSKRMKAYWAARKKKAKKAGA